MCLHVWSLFIMSFWLKWFFQGVSPVSFFHVASQLWCCLSLLLWMIIFLPVVSSEFCYGFKEELRDMLCLHQCFRFVSVHVPSVVWTQHALFLRSHLISLKSDSSFSSSRILPPNAPLPWSRNGKWAQRLDQVFSVVYQVSCSYVSLHFFSQLEFVLVVCFNCDV